MSQQPTARAEAITRRTYNRALDDDGKTLETWEQTVERATRVHHRRLWENAGGTPNEAELDELYNLVLERNALVSGRTLFLGGTDYSGSRACSQFNCSYTRAQTVFEVVDIFWLLLNGCGVGFRPIAGTLHGFLKPIRDLEVISSTQSPEHKGKTESQEINPSAANDYHWTITVGDSAAAWAKTIGKLMNPPTCAVNKLTIDFSDVRGPGKRLRGYGWICNGSKPLEDAIRAIFKIMNSKAGDLLDEIDLLDVINWLGTVLSSRRSAQIALIDYGHPRWEQFASAKHNWWEHDNAHRQQSNNSLVFTHRPSKREIRDLMVMIWDCGGSEPGFVNGEAAKNRAPWFDGMNPCFAPRTPVTTADGTFFIEELLQRSVQIWDGQWTEIDNFRVTAVDQPVVDVELFDGSVMTVTPYHSFILENGQRVQARALTPGDRLQVADVPVADFTAVQTSAAYLKGFLIGDGKVNNKDESSVGNPGLELYDTKYVCMGRLQQSAAEITELVVHTNAISDVGFAEPTQSAANRRNMQGLAARPTLLPWCSEYKFGLPSEVFRWSRDAQLEFIAGYFDADGTAHDSSHGFSYQVTSESRQLLQDVQLLLKSLGVYGRIGVGRSAGVHDFGIARGGEYACKTSWRLTLSQHAAKQLANMVAFSRLVSFADKTVAYQSRKTLTNRQTVKAVTAAGVSPQVYCCTVPGTHRFALANGLMVGQCAEILLQSRGFCNLVTTAVCKYKHNFAALLRTLYVMGRANYRQTCVDLNDGILMPEWHQTNAALRLCGMSLTGIAQAPWLTDYQIKLMRNTAIAGAYSMADELGLPRPKLVTTIKPEGTGAKIMDVTEGVHKPLGRYIMNWVNFPAADPIVGILAAAGYRIIDNPSSSLSKLVCFPVNNSGCKFDMHGKRHVNTDTAVQQLEVYKRWNTLWTDHNTSITVSWDIAELDDIVEWLYRNWNDFVAVSWLRRADPTLKAKDLGYAYLPQEVVEAAEYESYNAQLSPVDWSQLHGIHDLTMTDCTTGQCPVR